MIRLARSASPRRVLRVATSLAWSARATGQVRQHLAAGFSMHEVVAPVPSAAASSVRGVSWGLRWRKATCLERSLVLQAWHATQGRARHVLVGVTTAEGTTRAHAWLEGEDGGEYVVLTRIPPP